MRTIAIVGGGYCGTVLATMLLRQPPAGPTRIVLLERGADVGRGVAFATRDHPYLLNVPVGRMSANPADAREFLHFLQRRQPDVDAESFVPRAWYGDYLVEYLQAARLAAPGHVQLEIQHTAVTAVHRSQRGLSLRLVLDDGSTLHADVAVLAVGNPPPRNLAIAQGLQGHPGYVEDPWTLSAATRPGDRLFLIGAGLTMVDVVLATAARTEGGHFHALSRHGLVGLRQATIRPNALHDCGVAAMLSASPSPRRMLRAARCLARDAEVEGGDWREAVNVIRGVAPELWQRMSFSNRAQFLRHLRPYWDVHRHRLPEAALTRLTHLQHSGRLEVHAGRLESVHVDMDGIAVQWRRRGSGELQQAIVDRVVNCTGPDYNLGRARDPLLRALVREGLAVADAHGLGLRTGRHGAVIDTEGWPGTNLHYLGPMLRAEHWETTAASELAVHAAGLAEHLREWGQSTFPSGKPGQYLSYR